MVFEKIDRSSWKRNEYFEHYFTDILCTYSMTVKLDITQIKKKRMKLYPAMLYYLATIVNRHSEFTIHHCNNMKKNKIRELISQMTLEEKAGLCSGANFWHPLKAL